MDPLACWRELLTALDTDDFQTSTERAATLHEWVSRGGFTVSPMFSREETLEYCEKIIDQDRDGMRIEYEKIAEKPLDLIALETLADTVKRIMRDRYTNKVNGSTHCQIDSAIELLRQIKRYW